MILTVMSFDPGKVTGAIVADINDDTWEILCKSSRSISREGEFDEVAMCVGALQAFGPQRVICEDFKPRMGPGMEFISGELIGAIRAWCYLSGAEFIRQSPSAIQGEVVKDVPQGKVTEHEMNATAHLQVYCKRQKKSEDPLKLVKSKLILPN
jgi:hypothetical protein